MLRRALPLLAAVLAVFLGMGLREAPAQATPTVTMTITRIFDPGNRVYRFHFSGIVSSRAAGEYVSVKRRECGRSYFTSFAGAQTREGGLWEAEQYAPRPGFDTNTYRAHWNDAFSSPVRFRGQLMLWQTKLRRGQHRVTVGTAGLNVDLRGRAIVLQRRLGERWRPIQRATLATGPRFGEFVATFAVPRRGWTLRALVPSGSAPCFRASVSEKWVS